ncbi:MAG: M24 family metallopeptidase [Chloroflexota bacterium]
MRAALDEAGLDALLVSAPGEENLGRASRYYFAAFTGSTGLVLILPERAIFAADFRYIEQAERECGPRGFEVFPALGAGREWFPKLVVEAGLSGKKVGLSKSDLTFGGYLRLQKLIGVLPEGDRPAFEPAPRIIETLRRRKDAEELALVQRAIDISDAACDSVVVGLAPEQTEQDVADAFRQAVKAAGGEDVSFDTIVAAGPWGAMPHAHPRNERLGAGKPIVIDMGARYGGYCSDLTRTVTIGAPGAKFREIYDIVFHAQQAAIAGIETGMSGRQAHDIAHDVIDAAGYGDRFGHGLGHGIGLDVHEAPHVGRTSDDVLEEGMVFTIEPGIYIPGWGGVRIEDIVVLENGKPRVLSHAAKRSPGS